MYDNNINASYFQSVSSVKCKSEMSAPVYCQSCNKKLFLKQESSYFILAAAHLSYIWENFMRIYIYFFERSR